MIHIFKAQRQECQELRIPNQNSRTRIKEKNKKKKHTRFIVVHPQYESYVYFLPLQISLKLKKFRIYKFFQSLALPLSIFKNDKRWLQRIHIKDIRMAHTYRSKISNIFLIKRHSYFMCHVRVTTLSLNKTILLFSFLTSI